MEIVPVVQEVAIRCVLMNVWAIVDKDVLARVRVPVQDHVLDLPKVIVKIVVIYVLVVVEEDVKARVKQDAQEIVKVNVPQTVRRHALAVVRVAVLALVVISVWGRCLLSN